MISISISIILILILNSNLFVNSQFLKSSINSNSCLNSNSNSLTSTESFINFDTVYSQFDIGQIESGEFSSNGFNYSNGPILRDNLGTILNGTGSVLRVILLGKTTISNPGYSNTTNFITTLAVNSQILTFTVNSNQSSLCNAIRTLSGTSSAINSTNISSSSSALTSTPTIISGCPYGPGIVAVGFSIPLASTYALTTITAQVVVLSPDLVANHLACVDLSFSPYYPSHFAYSLIHYFPIGLLSIYFFIYLIARAWASQTDFVHEHESQLAASLTLKLSSSNTALSKRRKWGAIWFGAWAGRQVVSSGSLRRFVTAELREIWYTIAWFSLVGTVAVNWPDFVYPIFAQTAWSALIYNASLPFTSPALPLLPTNSTPPPGFASQINSLTSPLYLNSTLPPVLLDLSTSTSGIQKWSQAIGVRHEDLWSICTFTFLIICGIIILVHSLAAAGDYLIDLALPSRTSKARLKALKTKEVDTTNKESSEEQEINFHGKESQIPISPSSIRSGGFSRMSNGDGWGEEEEEEVEVDDGYRPEDDFPSYQLHLALLQGNLTRTLLIFHLPLSIFSIYQISIHSISPLSTIVLACFTLAILCVIIPFYLMFRIYRLNVTELFTSLPILLSIGPLYNTYSDECTMFSSIRFIGNLIIAIVIGGVTSTGTAQAAVILFVEVADTLLTSLYLPWADNSAEGPLAFLLSISRIIIAVLLVVLSPAVAVSNAASSWLSYIILLMQGLVIILFFFGLIFKVLELGVRLFGAVPFDESRSSRGGGLFGALRKWDRPGKSGNNNNGNQSKKSKKQLDAKRKRLQLAGGGERRFSASETSTINTKTRMLSPQSSSQQLQSKSSRSAIGSNSGGTTGAGISRSSSAMSYSDPITFSNSNSSRAQYSNNNHYPTTALDLGGDDGFIMSAMSVGPWAGSTTGYVQPGAYSTSSPQGARGIEQQQQPILRSNPAWRGDQITVVSPSSTTNNVVPTSSTGFTRLGGGKSSSSNPYQLANSTSPVTTATTTTINPVYPPYPISSADHYSLPPSPILSSHPTTTTTPTNLRRLSQSAVIEMASINSDLNSSSTPPPPPPLPTPSPVNQGSILNTTRHQPRTSITLLPTTPPSSSALLSNSTNRYPIDSQRNNHSSSSPANKSKAPSGFFGRFKKQPTLNSGEMSTDEDDSDDDEEEEIRRNKASQSKWSGLLSGGIIGKKKGKGKVIGITSEDEMEELSSPVVEGGEKTFVVTRKPRPNIPTAATVAPVKEEGEDV